MAATVWHPFARYAAACSIARDGTRTPRFVPDEWRDLMASSSQPQDFDAAVALLTSATGVDDDLWTPFLSPTAMAGAVISTLGDPLGSQTVGATDAVAARIDEIQLDLGEGPCWDALRTRRPVLTADVHADVETNWPAAQSALRELDLVALYAFPLYVGAVDVGSVDLYSHAGGTLTESQIAGTTRLAAIVARQVLRRALLTVTDVADGMPDGPYSRREMHQASGMIAAQMSIDVDDAVVVLRGHAYASGRSVLEVAADVVARRIDFSAPDADRF